jgi:PelA/Pel-15E family pectate lyase
MSKQFRKAAAGVLAFIMAFGFSLAVPLVPQNTVEASVSFPSAPTYVLDFSRITAAAASARQTIAAGTDITNMPGVTRSIASGARQSNFNMRPQGGTLRASGSGTNTFIDPNGAGRRLESTVSLTGPLRVVIVGRSTISGSMSTVGVSFGGRTETRNVSTSNSAWTRVTIDFPAGSGTLSIDWPWTANDRLAIQRIEIFEGSEQISFPSSATYNFDFSRITAAAAEARQTIPAGANVQDMPGVTRSVASSARAPGMQLRPQGGSMRASGSGTNTFIDPNGAGRTLETHMSLSGPIRVVITGRSTISNSMATATVRFAGQTITRDISSSNSVWSTVTFEFPAGTGRVNIDIPWTATNRLAIQRIQIFEGTGGGGELLPTPAPTSPPGGNFPVIEYRNLNSQPASWYSSAHAILIADNFVTMQRNNGGWPRGTGQGGTNFPTNLAAMTEAERNHHRNNRGLIDSYFGRGITTNEVRFLFRVYEATRLERFRDSAMRGFNAIISAQYSNGGWPYYVTDRSGYRGAISFKDNAIPYIMHLMRDISNGVFPSISTADRTRARNAFDSGLNAILNLQHWYDANGRHLGRTWTSAARMGAWSANNHDSTMNPRWARQFEPPSIGTWETVRVIDFLMTIDNPDARVQRAISGGVVFMAHVEIRGYTHPTVNGDRVLVRTSGARDLWARFVCYQTLVPLFYDRRTPNAHPSNPSAGQWLGVLSSNSSGGIRRNLNTNGAVFVFNSNQTLDLVRSYANLSHERRNGYQYIGNYGRNLPANYAAWRQRNRL